MFRTLSLFRILVVLLTAGWASSLAALNISISAGVGNATEEIADDSGVDLLAGKIGALIIDTNQDGINIAPGTLLKGTYFNASDDYVAGITSSDVFLNVSHVGFSTLAVDDPGLSGNDPFFILWFPELDFLSEEDPYSIVLSSTYGQATDSSWLLPSDGGTFSTANLNGDLANLTAIPEPATAGLLLGLGILILRARTRRKQVHGITRL